MNDLKVSLNWESRSLFHGMCVQVGVLVKCGKSEKRAKLRGVGPDLRVCGDVVMVRRGGVWLKGQKLKYVSSKLIAMVFDIR